MNNNKDLKEKYMTASKIKTSLALTSLGHFLNDGGFFLFPVVATIFSVEKGFSPILISLMYAIYYGSSSVFTTFISYRVDRSRRFAENISTGIILISIGLLGLAYSLTISPGYFLNAMTLISTLIIGLGTGYYHPLGAAVIQDNTPPNFLGKALGINGGMGSVGRAVYPLLFFEIAVTYHYSIALTIISTIGIVGGIAIYAGLRESLKGSKSKDKNEKGSTLKASITRGVAILAILTFARSLATQGIVSWIPFYLSYTEGLGIGLSLGIMMTVMYAIAIIGQPFFGILVDRFDKRYLLILTTIGTGIFTLGFVLTRGYLSIIMIVIFAFFNFSGFPLLMSLTRDYVPKTSSLSNSLVWGIASTGGTVLGPVIVGAYLFNSYVKLSATYEILASLIIIIGLFTFMLPKPSTKSKMPLFM
ncbi:MAG: MFS transporter [Thermoplasmata archaeon]